ncbi:hypothetical protein [Rhodanobacter lindaniclasticus]
MASAPASWRRRAPDGGQLVLAWYCREAVGVGTELLDWAQRLVDELSRFWDHQILLERRHPHEPLPRRAAHDPAHPAANSPTQGDLSTLARALADITSATAVELIRRRPGQDVCAAWPWSGRWRM